MWQSLREKTLMAPMSMSDVSLATGRRAHEHSEERNPVKMDQFLLKKVAFSEDDRVEYPALVFKTREGSFAKQPYFSVLRGEVELATLPLNIDKVEKRHESQTNMQRIYCMA